MLTDLLKITPPVRGKIQTLAVFTITSGLSYLLLKVVVQDIQIPCLHTNCMVLEITPLSLQRREGGQRDVKRKEEKGDRERKVGRKGGKKGDGQE